MEELVVIKPPRRISEAPSARNLKPRRISAVRRWPPGCGRSLSPPPPPLPPSDDPQSQPLLPSSPLPVSVTIHTTTIDTINSPKNPVADDSEQPVDASESKIDNCSGAKSLENLLKLEGVELPNGNLLAEKEKEKEKEKGDWSNKRWMNSKVYPPPKRRAGSAFRRYPPGCGRDADFSLGLIDKPLENCKSSLRINHQEDVIENKDKNDGAQESDEIVVPIEEEDENRTSSLEGGNANGEIKANEQSGGSDSKSKGKELRVEKEEAKSEPDVDQGVAIQNPKAEGLCENAKKIEEKKKKKPVQISDINKPKSEQRVDTNSEPSKEMVVYSEPSKGKEKVVMKKKKKVVVRKSITIPQLGESSDKETRLVSYQARNDEYEGEDEDATLDLSQVRPLAYAMKSVVQAKKKERRVAKKCTRPVKGKSFANQMMTLTLPPVTPSDGDRPTNARGKVKRILRLFQMMCRVLVQKEESRSGSSKQPPPQVVDETGSHPKKKTSNRVDLKAIDIVKKSNEYVNPGVPVVGHVPGVEVGDEFRYRVELHLIGVHRPLQSGIDWTKVNGIPVASSIVASGGYSDDMDGSDVLIYTGCGGKPSGKKGQRVLPEDQKLEGGNLALKNSMDMQTPVRVVHGLNTSETRKVVLTFTYDGLYLVEEFWQEPEKYKIDGEEYIANVFKFKMRKMPGQPELGLHKATKSKKSKVREGLCVADISYGKEKIPICAINTIDDKMPPRFEYITSIIYPSWSEKTRPNGCDCSGKCCSLKKCGCALKNGGEIPFNFNGAIVQAKRLIYECGPSCRCPPSCHNRVSQSGIKTPVEIFKTESRGWGVRSLSSIPSGSFVCEYVGELLRDEEAERRDNDEYLFDIGHNYDDSALWEGLPSCVPGIGSTRLAQGGGDGASEGLTIDAAKMGNVGRFINHSCSPNLYAQNVLFDHDDKRMPHIMFFAAENIPPLEELTYHYNYTIGQVRDSYGNEKVKKCYCGSSECEGRLY